MNKVVEKLGEINQTLEGILKVIQKPKNKFIRVLELVVLFVGAMGIFIIADVIRNWIIGG